MIYDNKEELIKIVKDFGQSLIDNSDSIVGSYGYRRGDLTITCRISADGADPIIEVYTEFVPENFVKRMCQ